MVASNGTKGRLVREGNREGGEGQWSCIEVSRGGGVTAGVLLSAVTGYGRL